MIQVNLIPDLKAEYLKAQRNKRLVMGIAFIVSASFIGLVVFMFLYVNAWQAAHTNGLNGDIEELSGEYASIVDLDKVITVQKQLNVLPKLHEEKPQVSRFIDYLSIITPEGPEYSAIELDFDDSTIELIGTADDPGQVNQLANTIKNAVFTTPDIEGELSAFSNVLLDTLNNRNDKTNFTIVFSFDPEIFSNQVSVQLTVPKIDSTNSELSRPRTQLFDTQPNPEEGAN